MRVTAHDMLDLKLIDGIINEPLGGAHSDLKAISKEMKKVILELTKELQELSPQERIDKRIDKFCQMGVVKE